MDRVRPRHPIFGRFQGREACSYKLTDQIFEIRSWSAAPASLCRSRVTEDLVAIIFSCGRNSSRRLMLIVVAAARLPLSIVDAAGEKTEVPIKPRGPGCRSSRKSGAPL